ncbi:aldehyde dehydrogenase [Rhodococcus opacus]|uniref:aldehyde dehydrogenase n=1 Tax=Rhodococcus opacus TaxID=37919 RepID=UPI001C43DFBC|nr:aldehyde dehydrogenase [Rhodococcus opacus]MBV6756672.1 aldehyde dehydrogenase [Rhodococcus opacus]
MTITTQASTALDRRQFFVNGEWVKPIGTDTYELREAGTGEPLGVAALGSPDDIDAAAKAARVALDSGPWGGTTATERAAVMREFAVALAARGEATAELVTRENGMPIALSKGFNGAGPASLLKYYAKLIEQTPLETTQPSHRGSTIIRREPVGVVGAISPWNYPQSLAMFKIAPALAAGCTVVLKPSPETALDAYAFADVAAEIGLPPGVLNVVAADREAGAALVSHPMVDKIGFTGSTAAGRAIGAQCAQLVRRCTLELGGKSAAIVLDDVDLDVLRGGLGAASFLNNSQTCTTQSRILVPRSRYDEIVDAIAEFARNIKVGDPLDPATECGPMATEHHLERVRGYIDIARESSARLIVGGGRPAGLDRGWFVEPTVFADVSNDDRLAREEVFGPVIAVIPYDDDDDAVRIANDSNYGLAGTVWTGDEERGLGVARRIRTGTIGVNYYDFDIKAPFGGMKESGLGRELGPQGLDAYLEYKSIFASANQLD